MNLSAGASRPKVKTSNESVLFGFNFGPILRTGETIDEVVSVTCTSAEQTENGGATVDTEDLDIGDPETNGTAFEDDDGGTVAIAEGVQVRIEDGVDGGNYVLSCIVDTTDGNRRELWPCVLQVRDG